MTKMEDNVLKNIIINKFFNLSYGKHIFTACSSTLSCIKHRTAAAALLCSIILACAPCALPPVTAATNSGSAPALNIAATSAILTDAASGRVLFSQNPNKKLPPASVTKVMTMLLICEAIDSDRISLSDKVTISERAAGMGGSQMYMEPGEVHTLDELLTGISMVSANDACAAAAEYISGSIEIFVEEMNKRATALGLQNTHFVNTNGLPVADHYSSAYDIAKIF